RTLRYLALLIPVSVLLMVLSPEVVRLLFERGRFYPAATRVTADVLVWFLAGAVGFAASTVVVRGYFATRDTLFPAVFGTVAVLATLPLYPLGIFLMGVEGVALAVSFSGLLQVVLLFILWGRRSGNAGQREVLRAYLKMALLGAALAPFLAAARWLALEAVDPAGPAGSLAVSVLVAAVFTGLLLLAGYGLKIGEITEMTAKTLRAMKVKA
nr:murein biosynthesis integral membrane protein MurJ [Desulfobacterales bacterium]